MKQLAIEDFMAEMDGILTGMNNFDLYRFLNGTSQVIPNDKDLSFGGPPSNLNRPQTPLLAGAARNVLIRRAFNVTAARNAYFNTIRSLSQITGTGGWLESEISRIYNQIRTAARDDPKKQCFTGAGTFTCTNVNFEDEVTANLQFARQRGDYALNQITALSAEEMYAFNARGGVSLTNASRLRSGYVLVDSDIGSPAADGVGILSNRQNGILISETAARASPTIQHGSIYVDAGSGVRTALAIANAGRNDAIISFSFTAADGTTSIRRAPVRGEGGTRTSRVPSSSTRQLQAASGHCSPVATSAASMPGPVRPNTAHRSLRSASFALDLSTKRARRVRNSSDCSAGSIRQKPSSTRHISNSASTRPLTEQYAPSCQRCASIAVTSTVSWPFRNGAASAPCTATTPNSGSAASTGCRSYCERNYPCPQPYAAAPYCPPAPAYGAVPAAPVAGAYGPGVARTGCTCTCP